MSSYREVSEEATQTFTAQCVPSLLPAHRYKCHLSLLKSLGQHFKDDR